MNIRTKTQTVSCVVAFTLSFPAALGRSQRAHEPATVLVSVNTAGTAGGSYFDPVISANGRFVTFVSFASDLVTNDTNDTNGMLDVFVRDLKTGMDALEERARSDLGMIARNETFYQVVPPRPADASHSPTRTAAAR